MKQLKNCTEEYVKQYVVKNIVTIDTCRCRDCCLDIMAIMLNKLPAHYVVTDKGAVYAQLKQLDYQYLASTAVAFAEAAEIVGKQRRHE